MDDDKVAELRDRVAELEAQTRVNIETTSKDLEELKRVVSRLDANHDVTQEKSESAEEAIAHLHREFRGVIAMVGRLADFQTASLDRDVALWKALNQLADFLPGPRHTSGLAAGYKP